jgi:hypothetical protein
VVGSGVQLCDYDQLLPRSIRLSTQCTYTWARSADVTLARPNVLVLAADADLLVVLIEGRAQAGSAVALRLGGTESVLLALFQVVVLRVV